MTIIVGVLFINHKLVIEKSGPHRQFRDAGRMLSVNVAAPLNRRTHCRRDAAARQRGNVELGRKLKQRNSADLMK